MDAPLDGTHGIEECAAFEAGPVEFVQWRTFDLPKYGMVLGVAVAANVKPWMKFNTCGSHPTSKKYIFSASDVIPHDRTRIPILPQRAISTAAQAFPMQPRSFSTIAQAFPLQPRSFSTAAQEPGISD